MMPSKLEKFQHLHVLKLKFSVAVVNRKMVYIQLNTDLTYRYHTKV